MSFGEGSLVLPAVYVGTKNLPFGFGHIISWAKVAGEELKLLTPA